MFALFVICFCLVVLIATMFILCIVNLFSSNRWFCRALGWHKEPNKTGFDGVSLNGRCPRCGKHVLLDSQGNWF